MLFSFIVIITQNIKLFSMRILKHLNSFSRLSCPVFLRKAQTRRMTADWREEWTPAAASRVGGPKVDTFRGRSWCCKITRWECKRRQCNKKWSNVSLDNVHGCHQKLAQVAQRSRMWSCLHLGGWSLLQPARCRRNQRADTAI